MFMQALHFGFALGGAISPMAIAPFLIPEREPSEVHNSSIENITMVPSLNSSLSYNFLENVTEASNNTQSTDHPESILYIGFSISAALNIACSIPIFFIFLQRRISRKKAKRKMEDMEKIPEKKEEEKHHVKMTKQTKIFVVIVLLSIFTTYCAVEDTFMSFLSTFVVRQLKWTKFYGALLTSAFWAAFAVGRLAGIFLVVIFAPVTLIFMHASLELIAMAGIFLSAWYNIDIGMWIFAPILGFAMSVIFPSVFTWTEESFLPVSGRISSLFLFGACCGSSINPIILGEIMDHYSNMWFVYLLSGEAVLLFLILLLALYICKKVLKPRHLFQDVIVEVRSETDEDDHRSIIGDGDIQSA